MDTHDHAQQIFSMMIAGMAAGPKLPGVQEVPKYAELAVLYADAFEKKHREMEIAAQRADGKYV